MNLKIFPEHLQLSKFSQTNRDILTFTVLTVDLKKSLGDLKLMITIE